MSKRRLFCPAAILFFPSSLVLAGSSANDHPFLEEVIVTAQKREESLQQAPIAISVLGRRELEAQRIRSLDALQGGAIPSLRVQSGSDPASTLVMAIRGNGPIDLTPVTREPAVGVYVDGIYLGRPQGLNMEIPDLERIEVLRGPQGTLFGRNTTAGAVSLVTRKPTGKFSVEQTLGAGNYNAFDSVTRINLPEYAGVSVKLDYLHSERDGWVKNNAPHQEDYDEYTRDGGRVSLRFQPVDEVTVDYVYDNARGRFTSGYFQVYQDNVGLVGNERDRVSNVRAPIPLSPTYVWQQGHSLIASWDVSSHLTIKSLTGYRILDEENFESWGAALYFDGLINMEDDRERQFSQEFQFIGAQDQIDWVGGLYYFKGFDKQRINMDFALDTFGNLPGNAGKFNTPIVPPTNFSPIYNASLSEQLIRANTKSSAIYGQLTWTPEILERKLHLTAGGRYTQDKKWGSRQDFQFIPYDLDTHHWDTAFTASYSWTDDVSTYLKRSTGYRSGSVNPRSTSFTPYDPERVTTWEAGLKSEFLERRIRFNADVFDSRFRNMQQDYRSVDPTQFAVTETINSEKAVRIRGLEFDLTATPIDGLVFALSYTYLDVDNPAQPNPLAGGALHKFEITQAPRNAGAFSADYTFAPTTIGTFTTHFDMTSTSGFAHQQQDIQRQVGYTLFNARLALTGIPVGVGSLEAALWGKNLGNKEYPAFAFPNMNFENVVTVVQTFGTPRTFGLDLTYRYD